MSAAPPAAPRRAAVAASACGCQLGRAGAGPAAHAACLSAQGCACPPCLPCSAVVARMASDPAQAVFGAREAPACPAAPLPACAGLLGTSALPLLSCSARPSRCRLPPRRAGVLGNSNEPSALSDAIGMPVDDETLIPLTEEEIAALPSERPGAASGPAAAGRLRQPASAASASRMHTTPPQLPRPAPHAQSPPSCWRLPRPAASASWLGGSRRELAARRHSHPPALLAPSPIFTGLTAHPPATALTLVPSPSTCWPPRGAAAAQHPPCQLTPVPPIRFSSPAFVKLLIVARGTGA